MNKNTLPEINSFWSIGINYRKSDVHTRGIFALHADDYAALLQEQLSPGLSSFFVLSTCNRTEIYGIATNAELLARHLCSATEGSLQDFESKAEIKQGQAAIEHLYQVAAGLDSQILGDYEIVGQLKDAVNTAKKHHRLCSFLERLFHSVLQSARSVRAHTQLSTGTVSVAFAAVHYANLKSKNLHKEQVLILGMGNMGIAVCKNLLSLSPKTPITIINRTYDKAAQLSADLGVACMPWEELPKALATASIVIVATNASEPILGLQDFDEGEQKLLIDLSIPNNIHPEVQLYKGLSLTNVDELSKINDATLRMRQAEVPIASDIIQHFIAEFADWYQMRQYVPVLQSVKEKLNHLQQDNALRCAKEDGTTIQKAINKMAKKIKNGNQRPGCTYIETIHGYLQQAQEQQKNRQPNQNT